jgi:hypothetical protein
MSDPIKRLLAAGSFFLWTVFIVAAFYVTQKPLFLKGIGGLVDTGWVLVVWILLVGNAACLGNILFQFLPETAFQPVERLIIGTGIGMGLFGLIGFLFGIFGWMHPVALFGFQTVLLFLFLWQKKVQMFWRDIFTLRTCWHQWMACAPIWLKAALASLFLIAFLLALAPPAEAFDALFYHLVSPERTLMGQGLQPSSVPHFWFPALPEGLFLWVQGLQAVRTTQLLHLTWAVLALLLLWYWAATTLDQKTAQGTLIISLSIPSLYLLASWAYTDFSLTFYCLAAIYGVWKAFEQGGPNPQPGWIILAGVAAGMSMAVKYTSFPVPISTALLIFWWGRKDIKLAIWSILKFSLFALGVAAPWYLRTWIVMGNPFYPFVFGGLYWDSFRADWYAQNGTGIGWNLKELLLLPFTATLGYRDANYYDGRIGPLFLILAPFTIYVLIKAKSYAERQRRTLLAITLVTLLTVGAWTLGVINSSALWQTRLLLPVLILFALPTALALKSVRELDTAQLRISYIFNFVVIAVVSINVIDAGISLILRNPIAFAVGAESEQAYLAKVQPAYAQALSILESTPEDAFIYYLFEPRSFGSPRQSQIDPILDNFAHDWFIHGEEKKVLQAWRSNGYTHVLIYRRGVDFLSGSRTGSFQGEYQAAFDLIVQDHLKLLNITDDGAYELYQIPPD